jgi:hypothetical protein
MGTSGISPAHNASEMTYFRLCHFEPGPYTTSIRRMRRGEKSLGQPLTHAQVSFTRKGSSKMGVSGISPAHNASEHRTRKVMT